jgi:hypothetical protein
MCCFHWEYPILAHAGVYVISEPTEMKYLSESGGRWRESCFHNWINQVDRLQVLVHPFWWYDKVPQENY